MAVSFRSASEDARNTSNPPVTTPPAGTVAGDLLLAVQVSDRRGSMSAMSAPSGWSEVARTSRSDVGFVKVWRKTATSSEPAQYEWEDSTSAGSVVVVAAVSGWDESQPFAVVPTWSNGASSQTHPAPSVTGVAGGLLLTAHIAGTGGTTRSYTSGPSGMELAQSTSLSSDGYVLIGVYHQALDETGPTGGKIATCSASRPYITMSLVVREPSSLVVSPTGIDSGEAFGVPSVSVAGGAQVVTAIGIPAGEAFGTPAVATFTLSGLYPGFYPGATSFPGTVVDTILYPQSDIYPGDDIYPGEAPAPPAEAQTILASAIPSAEAFGSPIVAVADGPQIIIATGIDSAEAFPLPTVTVAPPPPPAIEAVGIFSGEAFGRPTLTLEIPVPSLIGAWVDTYFIDGIDLHSHAWRIETAEGLLSTPGVVGDDVALPGRDGELQVFGGLGQPRRPDAIGRITFNLWLLGVDPDTGLIPADSITQAEWLKNWDRLVRLLHRRRVVLDHPRPDGSIRRAFAHLLPDETISPSRSPGSPWFGRLRVSYAIPGAHWTDLQQVTTGQLSLTTNGHVDLSAFAAATAPCTELQVVFGSGNNPRLSSSTGHVGWNGVIAPGRQLGIDTSTGFTHQASGGAWVPGFENLSYAPGPRLFEVDPSEPLQAIFTHTTGAGVEMTVEVSGKRRYRTS